VARQVHRFAYAFIILFLAIFATTEPAFDSENMPAATESDVLQQTHPKLPLKISSDVVPEDMLDHAVVPEVRPESFTQVQQTTRLKFFSILKLFRAGSKAKRAIKKLAGAYKTFKTLHRAATGPLDIVAFMEDLVPGYTYGGFSGWDFFQMIQFNIDYKYKIVIDGKELEKKILNTELGYWVDRLRQKDTPCPKSDEKLGPDEQKDGLMVQCWADAIRRMKTCDRFRSETNVHYGGFCPRKDCIKEAREDRCYFWELAKEQQACLTDKSGKPETCIRAPQACRRAKKNPVCKQGGAGAMTCGLYGCPSYCWINTVACPDGNFCSKMQDQLGRTKYDTCMQYWALVTCLDIYQCQDLQHPMGCRETEMCPVKCQSATLRWYGTHECRGWYEGYGHWHTPADHPKKYVLDLATDKRVSVAHLGSAIGLGTLDPPFPGGPKLQDANEDPPNAVSCFPADAMVTTTSGEQKMEDLRVGDKVLSVLASGALTFEDVYFFGHADPKAVDTFSQLQLAGAPKPLQISDKHFVPLCPITGSKCNYGEHVYKYAREVVSGDHLWIAGAEGSVDLTRVEETGHVLKRGKFNPYTVGGSIVVNSVLASAHSEWVLDDWVPSSVVGYLPKIYQVLFAPGRLLYMLLGVRAADALDMNSPQHQELGHGAEFLVCAMLLPSALVLLPAIIK
jgi:hypothetical protein